MKSLTKTELDALLAATPEPDRLMFLVAFNHGLRVSEVVNLNASNIVDGHLVVQRLKRSRRTTQPLLPNEKDGLLALAKQSGKFFPISRWTADRRLKEYGKKAGIPEHLLHMHCLKHSCGRLGFKGGMSIPEIQAYLGHKNGGNTMIYLQASEEEAANAFAAAVGK
jgi:integrase/recombinase XerD